MDMTAMVVALVVLVLVLLGTIWFLAREFRATWILLQQTLDVSNRIIQYDTTVMGYSKVLGEICEEIVSNAKAASPDGMLHDDVLIQLEFHLRGSKD